jgi:putative sterol carrier protein
MSAANDPAHFYEERVPAQFNRTLDEQASAAEGGDEAAGRLLEGMRSVNATIAVVVQDGGDAQRFCLNVENGRMAAASAAASSPFMTLIHDMGTFAVLERESGDSILGFLGALAGMQDAMKLTSQRIQNLHGLAGSLRFELTGDQGMMLIVHFGDDPVPAEPSCTIRISGDAYGQLRSGELAPMDAFMNGAIEVEGDMQMAMQMALAAMSPE